MKQKLVNRKSIFAATAWVALGVFLAFTHPAKLPVYALLVPFLLLGLATYATLSLFIGKFIKNDTKHQKMVAILLALFIMTCAGLQSVGQLTVRDFITVLLAAILGYFYVYRNIIASKQ